MNRSALRMRASTLVETLVAMAILLILFGIGILVFVNITRASRSDTRKQVDAQMLAFSLQVEHDLMEGAAPPEGTVKDSILYTCRMEQLADYPDRRRLVVTASWPQQGQVIDSLVRYIENEDEN